MPVRSICTALFLQAILSLSAGLAYASQPASEVYASLEVHLGYENEVSADRINYPLYILLSETDWRTYNEQFRQLGVLVDMWDQAQHGGQMLEETRNVPLQGVDGSVYERQIRILRADWHEVGQKCGYRKNGTPHSGCAFNKRLPRCTIVVPHQQLYADGDINEYHQLLGHEMWHCLVGSFH